MSNKAAARFDKANSQHTAAKEMIRMAESQLSTVRREGPDPSSPSPIDLAWQEMLNHATIKVKVIRVCGISVFVIAGKLMHWLCKTVMNVRV